MDKNTFEYQNLYAGSSQVVRGVAKLAKGNKIEIGTVLGLITDTKEVVPVDITRTDSAKAVYAVSVTECDATDAAQEITVDLSGEFNVRQLKFAPNNTAADHEYSARLVGIFFKNTVSK